MGPFCDTCSDFYMEKTESISFFPLAWIYITVYAMVENEPQWFANGSTTYLYHVNTDLIMTMHLIWI